MAPTTDTRQRILEAALGCFAAGRYAGTSVYDIVSAAGVSRPAIYYHFRDKAGLYRTLVEWAADERLRAMREAVTRSDALVGQLKEVCVALFESAHAHREGLAQLRVSPGVDRAWSAGRSAERGVRQPGADDGFRRADAPACDVAHLAARSAAGPPHRRTGGGLVSQRGGG